MWNASIVVFEPNLESLHAVLSSAQACSDLQSGVVVDNGTSAEAKALVTQFPKFRYELNPDGNAGFGNAHNFAFRSLPAAPFHAVLNPDIRFEPEAIRRLLEAMAADRTIQLTGPALYNADGSQQLLCKRYPSIRALLARRFLPLDVTQWLGFDVDANYFEMRDADYAREIEPEFLSGALMMFRRDTYERLRGFDERFFLYFEDCDITLRARRLGRAVYVPGARVTHDWARGSHRSLKLTWVTVVSLVRLFNKHGWRWRDPNLALRHF
ncbi:MAG: glycosyltransferase family 2 protein [Betaproteobacteria bacterium]|nr:MAG: glycosyltransferase family 2 protein [Betaproteobacteria bacterium]